MDVVLMMKGKVFTSFHIKIKTQNLNNQFAIEMPQYSLFS